MNNTSEAKVPNDEGNWQSIEIYLFSNGQQYSPPRKYHLQAEELNWWDATLNYLARAHYGIQHPLIYLYTIDGRLVEGPLELKDGQAYVAVEPPGKFIDAGYQKYLIRASRSWERRQAKKKIQAGNDQPLCACCTCPDKDCQLHGTCCLCPEKERAVPLEPLLPAIPQRNPLNGHYVSSGHGKPIPPDTLADNSKAAAGEYGARMSERRPSPYEQAIQSGYESGLEESDLTSAERGPRGGEHRPRPCDNDIPNEYEARLEESEVRPADHGPQSGESEIRAEEYMVGSHDSLKGIEKVIDSGSAQSAEHKTGPNDYSTSPDKKEHPATEQIAKPTDYEADVGPKLDENLARTDESETSLDENRDKCDEDAVKLTEQTPISTNQATDQIRSSKEEPERDQGDDVYRPETDEREARIPEPGEKMSEYRSTFPEKDTKSEQRRSVSDESGFKTDAYVPTTVAEGRSHRRAIKSNKIKEKLGENRPKSSGRRPRQDNGTELDQHANTPDKYPNMLGEHTDKSNEHDDRTGKHKRISDEKEDKHYDPNNALGEQEKVSENKRQDSKLERDPPVIVHNYLTDDSSGDNSPARSTGSAAKIRAEINRKKQDSRFKSERNDKNIVSGVTVGVTGGREVEGKENKEDLQRKSTDQGNTSGKRGTKENEYESSLENEYESSLGDPNRKKTERNGEMEHSSRRSVPIAEETGRDGKNEDQENDNGLSEERDREHEHVSRAGETAYDGKEGEPRTRQQRHNGRACEDRGYTSKLVPQITGETGHHVRSGEASAVQQGYDSGVPEKRHREREHGSRTVGTAHDGREGEPKTRQQGQGGRATEDRGREHNVTKDEELRTGEPGHDREEEERARQQEYDQGALDEKGKEREHGRKAGEAARDGREGEPRTRQQRHNGRVSEERKGEHEYSSKLVPQRTGETGHHVKRGGASAVQRGHDSGVPEKRHREREHGSRTVGPAHDSREGEPKHQGQGGRASEDRGREHDVTRDGELRTGEPGHDSRKEEATARQQEYDKGALDEKERERGHGSGATETGHCNRAREIGYGGREGESRPIQQDHSGRASEDRGTNRASRASEQRVGQNERVDTDGEPRSKQQEHGGRASAETEYGIRTRETGNGGREGESKPIQQDHSGRASEDSGTNRASRASEQRVDQTERIDTDGEPRSKQQGHGGRASAEIGSERDVVRDIEQRTGETIHDRIGGKSRAKRQEHGSGTSEEINNESEYARRAEDTESNGREGEPRAKQLEHGGKASEERGQERDYTSKVVPQRTHHVKRGDASAKQQKHRSGASGEISKERKYANRAEDTESIVSEGEPRTKQQGSGTKASENKGSAYDVIRDVEQRTGRDSRDARARQQELGSGVLEERGKERGYGSKAGEQRARESAHSDSVGYPKASNEERGGRASDEKSKASKRGPQKSGEIGHHGRRGEARDSQQEHGSGTSEEITKEREYASRTKDTERNGRDGEQRTRKQEHGKRASEDRGKEHDVTRNGEQINGKTSHDTKGEAARTGQQGHGNGVLEERGRDREHGGRSGEIDRDGRKREPKTIQQRHGVKASEEKGKERDFTRDGEHRTKETGHDSRGGESRARQQDREHGSKAGEQRAEVSGQNSIKGDPRAISRKERGGGVTDERGKVHEFSSKSGSQRTGEVDHRPRRKDQRTRQIDQIAKVGGHETRVGDHEARGGDFSVRASYNGARVSNPNSRSAETSARSATTGARGSPRDRMNPRARMGEPRLGLPAVRADEPVVRSDQPGVRDNADEPKIRTSDVQSVAVEREMGGTGAAGVPHISVAQQHVRSSNATEGKPMEKKRYSSLRRPTPYVFSSIPPRKSEDNKPIKDYKDVLPRKLSEKTPDLATNKFEKKYTQKETPKYPNKSIVPPAVPPPTANFNQIPLKAKSTSLTKVISNHKSLLTDSGPIENAIGNNEIVVVSTNLFRNQESEITSMRLDSFKRNVDSMKDFPDDMIKSQQNIPSIGVNEGVQTLTELVSEAVDKHGHAVSGCKGRGGCTVSSQRDNTVATDDPKENFISILNKGDVVNLKLNIEVRNDQSNRPDNSCQKSCRKSRSLTNITRTEKCSQISIDDDMYVQSKSLQSLLNNEYFRGCGSDGRPKILVVQCACCGRPNISPRSDPPRCSDSKKYFVLLPNPHQQDKDDRCHCESHCQSNNHKIHSQSRKSTSENTVKRAYSNMSLETVMVSGVSTHRRDLARCVATTNSSCQTEEPKSECLIAKHRVSITENSGIRCEVQKECHSQISVITPGLASESNCQKSYPQICSQTSGSKHVDAHVCTLDRSNPFAKIQAELCPEVCPDTCPLSPLHTCQQNCPQMVSQTQSRPLENYQGYSKAYSQVQSQGSSQTCQQVQSQGFTPACQQLQVKGCSHACASSQSQGLSQSQGSRQACSQGHLQVRSQTCTQVQSNSFPQAQSQDHPQVCSVTCPQGFPQVCPQIYLQVQSQACQPTCLQAQSQTCPQTSSQGFPPIRREVSDSHTQTQWCSVLLEARLHDDGRYSFHLPPLQVLKYYSF